MLTLHSELQLIADRLALAINGTARIVAAGVSCHLLQDQALIGTDDAGARVVRQYDSLGNGGDGGQFY